MGQSQGSSEPCGGWTISFLLYICLMPSTKCWDGRGSTEQRLEAGCIQLTPATSARWEERSPLFGNSSYSHQTTHRALPCYENGPCSPLPVLSSPSRVGAGSTSWLSKGSSGCPGMGMKSQAGNAPLCAAPLGKPQLKVLPIPASCTAPKHTLGSWPARADTDLGPGASSGLSPGRTALDVAELMPWPSLHWHHIPAAPGSSCVKVVSPCRERFWHPWAVP